MAAVTTEYELDPDLDVLFPSALDDAGYTLTPNGLEVTTGRGQLLAPAFPGTFTALSWDDLTGVIDPAVADAAAAGIGVLS